MLVMGTVAFTLCVVRRNFTNSPQYKAMLAAAKMKSILARTEIDVFIRGMWYFAKHYKTVKDINISAELLLLYMTEDPTSSMMRNFVASS